MGLLGAGGAAVRRRVEFSGGFRPQPKRGDRVRQVAVADCAGGRCLGRRDDGPARIRRYSVRFLVGTEGMLQRYPEDHPMHNVTGGRGGSKKIGLQFPASAQRGQSNQAIAMAPDGIAAVDVRLCWQFASSTRPLARCPQALHSWPA